MERVARPNKREYFVIIFSLVVLFDVCNNETFPLSYSETKKLIAKSTFEGSFWGYRAHRGLLITTGMDGHFGFTEKTSATSLSVHPVLIERTESIFSTEMRTIDVSIFQLRTKNEHLIHPL